MDKTTTLTTAQIKEAALAALTASQAAAGQAMAARTPASVGVERPLAATPPPPMGFVQRLSYDKHLKNAMKEHLPALAREHANVVATRIRDGIHAVRDQVHYDIFVRTTEQDERRVAARQVNEERLTLIEEKATDRWTDMEDQRMAQLQQQYQAGKLTEAAYFQRVMQEEAKYERLRARAAFYVEGIRAGTDAHIGFDKVNNGNNS